MGQDINRHILSEEYLPDSNFLLNDPSRMNNKNIQALLAHWYSRKKNMETPVEFAVQGIASEEDVEGSYEFSFETCFKGLELRERDRNRCVMVYYHFKFFLNGSLVQRKQALKRPAEQKGVQPHRSSE
jgi:hypothetical protein